MNIGIEPGIGGGAGRPLYCYNVTLNRRESHEENPGVLACGATHSQHGSSWTSGRCALTADVIVVGGGGAGLAAAVEAAQHGVPVILLEKLAMLGGNTIRSGGAYNAVDPERQGPQGIEDSIEWHYYQTLKGGDYRRDPALVAILVERAPRGNPLARVLGIEFRPNVFTVVGSLWPRAHLMKEVAGTGYIMGLEKAGLERGSPSSRTPELPI